MTTTVDDKAEETSEVEAFRWILPCHASRDCTVRFQPSRLGNFRTELPLGVWTLGRCILPPVPLMLTLEGVCDVPRVHIREAEGQTDLDRLEFGPVDLNDDKAAVAHLHLVNGGAFPAAARLVVETPRDAFGEANDADVFSLSLSDVELGVGEWQEVSVQAKPVEDGLVEGWLTCAVEDNPSVTRLPLSCIGAAEKLRRCFDTDVRPRTSSVDMRGSHASKGAEGVVDLGRSLLGSKPSTEFSIVNEGLLPMEWTMPSALPSYVSISPTGGYLLPQQRQRLRLDAACDVTWTLDQSFCLRVRQPPNTAACQRPC